MMGGRHCHAEVRFDDTVTWLLRIPIDNRPESREARNYVLQCEAATLEFLARETAVPAPKVHDWALEGDTTNELGPGYILMDKLPGTPVNWPTVRQEDPAKRQHLLTQMVDIFLELERHPLPSIGSLTSSSPLTLGRVAHPSVSSDEQTPQGPFGTGVEACRARLQTILDEIVTGEVVQSEPVDAFLRFTWMRRQVQGGLLLPKNDGGPFYLKHPDNKGDHILVDEQLNITGIIDWEWCSSTPKEYAFSSPCMLWPIDDWYASSNRLAEEEHQLAAIYRERGRDDLAQMVLNGRKLQRLWQCMEEVFSNDRDTSLAFFKGLLSASGVDVGPDEDWWPRWKNWALLEYEDDGNLEQLQWDEWVKSQASESHPSRPQHESDLVKT